MFSKSLISFVFLAALANSVNARTRIIERDGRALYGRRFGQEQNPAIAELSSACNGATCGVLAGKAVGTLLAASPECAQQDLADDIIDAAREQDATTQAKMIDIAKRFRQAEKNTPPDFTTNPPTNRNSVFCQTPPRNAELIGLNQAQDPANNPDDFFDPACKCTVKKGSQANTSPLASNATSGSSGGGNKEVSKGGNNDGGNSSTSAVATGTATETGVSSGTATATSTAEVSETATATAPANNDPTNTCPAVPTVTVTVDPSTPTVTATGVDSSTAAVSTDSSASSAAAASPTATVAPANGNIDLGSCSDPTIKFGAGIEGRKETSFIPNNLKDFNHGSAQNSAIITQFVCDTFVNSCKANQAAIDACKQARDAAAAAGAKKGAAADAFNEVFGVKTNFAAIQALDAQGRPVA